MRLLVAFLLVLGLGAAAWAGAPGEAITVAEWRDFLATIEERYDARASHAIASFFAVGASAEVYLWTDCVHGQTVGELSAWLRTTAPPELTLLEALELNADQHGCVARGSGDVEDARVARRSGIRP